VKTVVLWPGLTVTAPQLQVTIVCLRTVPAAGLVCVRLAHEMAPSVPNEPAEMWPVAETACEYI
jgi:hypothetical protein